MVHQGIRLDLESLPVQLSHPQQVQMTEAGIVWLVSLCQRSSIVAKN